MKELKYIKTFEGLFSSKTLLEKIKDELKEIKDATIEGTDSPITIKKNERKITIKNQEHDDWMDKTFQSKIVSVRLEYKNNSGISEKKELSKIPEKNIPKFVKDFMSVDNRALDGLYKQLFKTKL